MLYVIPGVIILLSLFFLTPLKASLPFVVQCTLVGGLLVIVGFYGVALFRERVRDEREAHIRALAHRISYVVGITVAFPGIATVEHSAITETPLPASFMLQRI